jgi:hypothetical protein
VNFLLAVFGLLTFTLVPATPGGRRKLLLVGALAASAYGVTVMVNALRIVLAVALHEGGLAWGWLSAERVHRLAGIVVYFVSLVGVHVVARHAAGQSHGGAGAASPLLMAPLLSYGLVAVALPLANGALAANPLLFAEHCAWIVVVTAALSLPWVLRRAGGHTGRLVSKRVRKVTITTSRGFDDLAPGTR